MKIRPDKTYITFLALVIIGSSIGISTLYNQSIRLDEAQSLWAATKSLPVILQFISRDVHVPLYDILLHFWIQLFGTGIVTARILSFIFFLLSVPVLYQVAKEAADDTIAMLSVLLYTLSPFIIWYSNEARMYTLLTLAVLINQLVFLRFFRTFGRTSRLGLFFSTLLGLYTHYFFLFYLFTQFIYLAVKIQQNIFTNRLKKDEAITLIKRYITGIGAAFLLFIPWIWYVISNGAAANTQPLLTAPNTYNIFQLFINFLFGFQTLNIQTILVSLWPLSALLLFFIFTRREELNLKNVWFFVLTVFLPIFMVLVISIVRPIFEPRYLIFVTPSLFILAAWLIMGYPRRITSLTVIILLFLMLFFSLRQNTSAATPTRENYEGVARYLNNNAQPDDIIAVSAPFTVYPIEYQYQGAARIETIPAWDRYKQGPIPKFSIKELQQQLSSWKSQYANVYVVLSYNQGYEQQIRDYMEHHYKRLYRHTFSPGLEIREYKLRYGIPVAGSNIPDFRI